MNQAITNYTFNASAKTITFTDFATIALERVHGIINLTTGQWIYKATDPVAFGGTVATNVLTFTATNSGMANGDDLLIRYDAETSLDIQQIKGAANSGVDIGDVTINNSTGGAAVNIQDGGNSITVDGTFWQATQPVSASALPLPSGASTAAKQPALGTAGTASADVITVQGITSMTALKTDGSGVTQPVSGTVTVNALPAGTNNIGDVDVLTLPALPAGTNAIGKLAANDGVDIGDVTINNASGASAVNIQDGGNSITVDGSVTVSGTATVTNAGTFAVQDSEKIADNAGFTDGTTKVVPVGFIYDEVAGTTVTENDIVAPRVDIKRSVVFTLEDETTRGRRATVTAANAVKVDASATTQPISAASLPLPSGAATAAKQPALGTAGSASADVITVQGVTSMTPLLVNGSGVTQPISGTVTINAIPAGTNNIGDVDVLTLPNVTNAGTFAVQVDGAALTALQLIDNIVQTEDTASADGHSGVPVLAVRKATPANTSGTDGDYEFIQMSAGRVWASATIDAAIPAGTNNIGDVDVLTLPALPTGSNVIGALTANQTVNVAQINGVTPLMGAGNTGTGSPRVTIATDNADVPVKLQAQTTGGLTTYHLVSAGSTNATVIKASAGQVYGWYIYNSNAAARKLVFHNASSTPTAGASVFFSLMIPATSGANVFSDVGIPFSTGISITTVTGLADNDTAAVASNDLIINIFYK